MRQGRARQRRKRGEHLKSTNGKPAVSARERKSVPRVVLGESDVATRQGLRMALEGGGIAVAAEADSADAVVEAAHRSDVCLISVDLPGGGLRAAAAVVAEHPDTAVIVLTGAADDDELVDAVRVGAVGYLVTDMTPTGLPSAVRAVMRGELAIPRSLTPVLADRLRERLGRRQVALRGRPGVELTTREWEVLDLMCDGLSTREIAGRLLISEITVRRHISAVLKKLRVESRRDAVKLLETA
jgi:two-component system, NarL family, nitrate/nitrite response regulator NarL